MTELFTVNTVVLALIVTTTRGQVARPSAMIETPKSAGVLEVNNQPLEMNAGFSRDSMTDATITANVRRLIKADDLLQESDIKVETDDAVVTLAGVVHTSAAKARAVQLARSVKGVVRVVDQLMIR